MKNILMIIIIVGVQATLTHAAQDAPPSPLQTEKDIAEKAANRVALILARKNVLPLLAEHQKQQWCAKIDYSSYLQNKWEGLWNPALSEYEFQKLSWHELAPALLKVEEKLKAAIPYKPFFSSYAEKEQAYKESGEKERAIDAWKLEGSEREKAVFIVVCNGIRAAMNDAQRCAAVLPRMIAAAEAGEEQEGVEESVVAAAPVPASLSQPVMASHTNSIPGKGKWLDALIFEKELEEGRRENFRRYYLERHQLPLHRDPRK